MRLLVKFQYGGGAAASQYIDLARCGGGFQHAYAAWLNEGMSVDSCLPPLAHVRIDYFFDYSLVSGLVTPKNKHLLDM